MALKDTNKLPPGGWIFPQVDAAGNVIKVFRDMGPFLPFCKEILGCRIGNKLPGATIECVMRDVDAFTGQRLNNDPEWVIGPSGSYNAGGRVVTGAPCCGG